MEFLALGQWQLDGRCMRIVFWNLQALSLRLLELSRGCLKNCPMLSRSLSLVNKVLATAS